MKKNFNIRIRKMEEITKRQREGPKILLWKRPELSEDELLGALSAEEKSRTVLFIFDLREDDVSINTPANCLTLSKEELNEQIREAILECKAEGVSDSVINQLVKAHGSNESKPAEHLLGPQAGQEADPAEPGDEITTLLSRKKRKRFRIDQG